MRPIYSNLRHPAQRPFDECTLFALCNERPKMAAAPPAADLLPMLLDRDRLSGNANSFGQCICPLPKPPLAPPYLRTVLSGRETYGTTENRGHILG